MFDMQNESQLAGIANLHLFGASGNCPICFISQSVFLDDMKTERFGLHNVLGSARTWLIFTRIQEGTEPGRLTTSG